MLKKKEEGLSRLQSPSAAFFDGAVQGIATELLDSDYVIPVIVYKLFDPILIDGRIQR